MPQSGLLEKVEWIIPEFLSAQVIELFESSKVFHPSLLRTHCPYLGKFTSLSLILQTMPHQSCFYLSFSSLDLLVLS